MDLDLRHQCRMAMRGVPERLGLSFAKGNIEMRAKPNGTAAGSNFEWRGYATVYDTDFPMWDPRGEPYTEYVAQGAAKRSLANPNLDVPFLIGHNDAGIPLARTKSGTMKLADDSHGVLTHVPSMDGSREEVRALASAVERGDLTEMSLAFVCLQQAWDEQFERRGVIEMDLHRGDVCAVTHGANPATAGAWMGAVEQLSYRRPAAIGGPAILGRERRMPTAPYQVNEGEGTLCPQCRSANDADASFCDQCGAKMAGEPGASTVTGEDETQQCQSCLCMNATDAKYCDQCGSSLAGVRPWKAPGGGYVSDDLYGQRAPRERRASAAEDMNLASSSDYDAAAAPHAAGLTCPKCQAGNHGGAQFCGQCGHGFADGVATSASVMVDDESGIPGDETQFAAARRRELLAMELELEELASHRYQRA
jgi:HK97 family phage prohead protease